MSWQLTLARARAPAAARRSRRSGSGAARPRRTTHARETIATVNAELPGEPVRRRGRAGVRARRTATTTSFRDVAARLPRRPRCGAQRLVGDLLPVRRLFLADVGDAHRARRRQRARARRHASPPAPLIAFLLYLDLFFAPIQQLSQVFDQYQQARGVDRPDRRAARRRRATTPDAGRPGRARPRCAARSRFDDVHFRYPTPRRRDAARRRPRTSRRARRSRSSARPAPASHRREARRPLLRPDRGDGARRRRARRPTSTCARSATSSAYVPQEAFLFSGTIRDNIAYGRPDATDAEVEAAARAVGAHDFIAALPRRLPPPGERARPVAVGRPAPADRLARAQLVDPAILLLDEATSNLDLGTEAQVQRGDGRRVARAAPRS